VGQCGIPTGEAEVVARADSCAFVDGFFGIQIVLVGDDMVVASRAVEIGGYQIFNDRGGEGQIFTIEEGEAFPA
jgi:hypothetical protein